MEATIVYWGYIGIMENRMEATMGPLTLGNAPKYVTQNLAPE